MSLVSLTDARTLHLAHRATDGVTVDFDATVIGQVALFVLLLIALKPILFEPMLKLFEERERRTDGARLEARRIDEASAGALAKYDAAMLEARAQANAERDRLRAEGAKAEAEIMATVRKSTSETLERGKLQMQGEAKQVRAALTKNISELAHDVAKQVLGREVAQ